MKINPNELKDFDRKILMHSKEMTSVISLYDSPKIGPIS